jgi:sialate O-acetylesterase
MWFAFKATIYYLYFPHNQSRFLMRQILFFVIPIFYTQVVLSQESSFLLAPLFGDNMVLRQKSTAAIWGRGTPGSKITVHASWQKGAATSVNPDGSWVLTLMTPSAGGPYTIDITHDDTTLTLKNVLIGEVWLCSGQSNMEMPLEGWPPDTVLQSAEEIKNSSYPGIRLFKVQRSFSAAPESRCTGSWVQCSPGTLPTFSATAYFFGRELHQNLKVPIGLILSSWGGTPVEAWTSGEFLSRVPGFDTTLQKIRMTADRMNVLQAWLARFPVVKAGLGDRATRWLNLGFQDEDCSSPQFDDSRWRIMRLPTIWERTNMGEFDGTVWFRKTVAIPAAWVHRDLVVELGPIDDIDVTYVNGHKVGSHETEGLWKAERMYRVPQNFVDTTIVHIAVRVIDYGGGGGMYGQAKSMCIHLEGQDERVSLAGDWEFLPVAEYRGDRFFVFGAKGEQFFSRPNLPFDFSAYTPTSLYNGMIAPLVPFSLSGVIWYQGEANTNAPAMYKVLFPLMIENWRSAFKADGLPFYFVQIAPFEYDPPTESQYLREAQFATLAVKNTGMAVTVDIGNVKNIHPANKQEVGRRLALWALARNYKKKLEFSGPLYRSSKKFKDRIELVFDHATSGLVLTQREQGNGVQIAGEDRIFRSAVVRVRGNRLIVTHPAITNPQAVRYAFSNTAQATLFNIEGLPSPSFRTDDWNR